MPDTGGPFGPAHPDYIDNECFGFAWVGQSFEHCNTCAQPYSAHRFQAVLDRGHGWVRAPIVRDEALGLRATIAKLEQMDG